MFIKKLIKTDQSKARPKILTFRQFSSNLNKPPVLGLGVGPIMMMGASLAGFAYLGYSIRDMNANKAAYLAQGHTYMSPLVQKRVSQTLGFFSYGIFSTASALYYLRNSLVWASIPWYALLAGSFVFLYGAHAADYKKQFPLKIAAFTAFTGIMGLSVLPLIQISTSAAIADASLATGLSMTSLAAIAYNAPSEQFLMWGGALSAASMGMFAVSLGSIFFPQSKALNNIWIYGGLGLTSLFTLYHTQAIIYRAKTQKDFDPLSNSISIYMDSINFFVRFLMIMTGNKKK